MKKWLLGSVAMAMATTMLVPVSVMAQTKAADGDGADVKGGSAAFEEITVTAERRTTNLQRTPVAVAALNTEALQRREIRTESDLQFAVPGLVVRAGQDSNTLFYSIRGQTVDQTTFSQAAVQPYVNEVPTNLNGASTLYDLESVQVLKGPQGTLFGRNVTGGAVLYTTAQPKNALEGYAGVRVGNYNLREGYGALNVPIVSDRVLFRGAFDIVRRDGFTKNLFDNSRVGDVDRDSFRGSLTVKPSETFSNALVVDYSRLGGSANPAVLYSVNQLGSTNNGIPLDTLVTLLYSPQLDAAVGFPGAWNAYLAAHPGAFPGGLSAFLTLQQQRGPYTVDLDTKAFNRTKNLLVSDTATFDVADNVQLKNVFGYVHGKTSLQVDQDGTPYLIAGGVQINKVRQFSDEVQVLGKAFDGQLDYVTGVYYYDYSNQLDVNVKFFDLAPIIPVTNPHYLAKVKTKSAAGYAQGTLQLDTLTGVSGLGITIGLRYTNDKEELDELPGGANYNLPGLPNVEKVTYNRLNWNFGLQEQVNPNLLLYAVTRRSFRAGGFNVYAPQVPGTAVVGGNGFDPESVKDVEAGLKFQGSVADIPTRMNLAVYNQWISNVQRLLLVVNPVTGPNALTGNIPKAEVTGAELETQVSPARWLELGGTLAYTNARYTNGTTTVFGATTVYGPYVDAPKWSGSLYAQVSTPVANDFSTLSVRGDLYFQSKYYFGTLNNTTSPGTDVPSYQIVNFRVALEDIGHSGLSVAAVVHNAFDKVSWVGGIMTGNVLSSNHAVAGEPRTFLVEAKWKF